MPLARSLSRSGSTVRAGPAGPLILDSSLTGYIEANGTNTLTGVDTLATSASGVCLIGGWAMKTALFSSIALNNSASYGAAIHNATFTDFNQYTLRAYSASGLAGGSAWQQTVTRGSGATEELSTFLIALASGSVVQTTAAQPAAAGAGNPVTSATFTVPAGNPGRVIAMWSGGGFALDGTVQGADIVQPGGESWVLLENFEHNNVTAPDGHVPLRLWARTFPAGYSGTWQCIPWFNEGGQMVTFVVQA